MKWSIASIVSLIVTVSAHAVDCSALPPCGGKAPREAWKYVMLVDGSGSMVTENLWEPLKEAMSEVVASLPDHALLEIAIFDARKSGGWGSSREPFYGDGDGGPPLAFDLSTPADRDRAIQSIELFATPDRSNATPLYWALDRCLQEQEAWLDGDPSKQFHIYLYSDGKDQFKGGTVTEADLRRRISALDESINLINGLSDWCQIVIGDKYDGLAMDGLPVIKSEGAIKLPLPPPSADLVAPYLPAAIGGVTTAELRVNVPCPAYMPGDIDLTVTGTQPGVTISVSPSSIPTGGGLQDVPLKFHVTGAEGQVRMAQQAELVVHFPDTNCDRRFLPQGSREARLSFSIAKDDSFSFDSSAVRVRPRVAMVDRDVAFQYLQPIAGVTPAWSRSDGGLIDAKVDDPWSALTSFTKPGHYEIVLSGERDGSDATASTTMTVEVLDFELSLQSPPIDALEGKPIQITATFSGSAQVIEFQWRMNGVPLSEVTTAPTTTVTPNRAGRTEVAVRARILVGDQEELTGWVTVIFEVRESPRIRVQSPHAAAWCHRLPVQAVTHGGVRRVTFSLLNAQGVTVSTAKAGVLTKERDDGRTVQLAEAQLEVPAKAGLYTVHAVADEHAGVADQATVEVTPPKVTLRPLGDVSRKLQLAETDHLIVEISSDTPDAVETVTWHVESGSGVVLDQISSSGGLTTPVVAPDGTPQVSIDLRFTSESNVPVDQLIRIIATPHICRQEGPSESHAVAFERTPVFKMPEWTIVRDGSAGTAPIAWGSTEGFRIDPEVGIKSVTWKLMQGSSKLETSDKKYFERPFKDALGSYSLVAIVTPSQSGAKDVRLMTPVRLAHQTTYAIVGGPDGPAVEWGSTHTYGIQPDEHVQNVMWTVGGPDGRTTTEARKLTHEFTGRIGDEWTVTATVNSVVPGYVVAPPTGRSHRVSYTPTTYSIIPDDVANATQGTVVAFSVTPNRHISEIRWFVRDVDGEPVGESVVLLPEEHFPYPFEGEIGSTYSVHAEVQSVVPGQSGLPPLSTSRTVTRPAMWWARIVSVLLGLTVALFIIKLFSGNQPRKWTIFAATTFEGVFSAMERREIDFSWATTCKAPDKKATIDLGDVARTVTGDTEWVGETKGGHIILDGKGLRFFPNSPGEFDDTVLLGTAGRKYTRIRARSRGEGEAPRILCLRIDKTMKAGVFNGDVVWMTILLLSVVGVCVYLWQYWI